MCTSESLSDLDDSLNDQYSTTYLGYLDSCEDLDGASTVDVQRSGGIVLYIHIGSPVMHQRVCEAVTLGSPWKRKREKEKCILSFLGCFLYLLS